MEDVAVPGDCCYLLFEKTVKRTVQSHVFVQSPPGRALIYFMSTARTAPGLCKIATPAVLFCNGKPYTVSAHSDMCVYTHILYNIDPLVGQNK
jgi:hypothetical protein